MFHGMIKTVFVKRAQGVSGSCGVYGICIGFHNKLAKPLLKVAFLEFLRQAPSKRPRTGLYIRTLLAVKEAQGAA